MWLRVADPAWADPLDPGFAQRSGQRWNPPDSFAALYLNEDVVTARINLRLFIGPLPYGPEDLRDDTGPVLVHAVLPAPPAGRGRTYTCRRRRRGPTAELPARRCR